MVGYKPSFGTINRFGMKLMSESLDTVGVMARSVADCALFAGAVAGRDLGDPDARPGAGAAHRRLPVAGMGQALAGDPGAAAPASPRRWRGPAPPSSTGSCRPGVAAIEGRIRS